MSENRERILIVDDERFYINVLVEMLRNDYEISVASGGEEALRQAQSEFPPDLILLDILMPKMDGYEVCRLLKADQRTVGIPIIYLTIKAEVDYELKGFELGAVDYITKPVNASIVLARVSTQLALRQSQKQLAQHNSQLEVMIEERTQEIGLTQDVAILCMASLAETRDNETGYHIRRTQHYVKLLADYLCASGVHLDLLNDRYINLLFKSAPLHDIGKVGVADRILLHPGPLHGEDWEEMKRHTDYGVAAIERAEGEYGSTHFLNLAKEIVGTHHEKWNGSGYPLGLKAEAIPLSGRLMAVADVYDALISIRVYKPAFPHEEAVEYILSQKGDHFDPELVVAFEEIQGDFAEVARRFKDE